MSGTDTPAGDKVEYDYSPSGAVITNASGIPGRMSQGSVYWAGFPNNYWFLDREKGVGGSVDGTESAAWGSGGAGFL